MKNVKLSDFDKNEYRIFLYDGKTVGIQYILRMIWNNKKLPKIELCYDTENFDNAIEHVLKHISEDINNGIDKEEYTLHNLKTQEVEIDITKNDIVQLDNDGYEFYIIKNK